MLLTAPAAPSWQWHWNAARLDYLLSSEIPFFIEDLLRQPRSLTAMAMRWNVCMERALLVTSTWAQKLSPWPAMEEKLSCAKQRLRHTRPQHFRVTPLRAQCSISLPQRCTVRGRRMHGECCSLRRCTTTRHMTPNTCHRTHPNGQHATAHPNTMRHPFQPVLQRQGCC